MATVAPKRCSTDCIGLASVRESPPAKMPDGMGTWAGKDRGAGVAWLGERDAGALNDDLVLEMGGAVVADDALEAGVDYGTEGEPVVPPCLVTA